MTTPRRSDFDMSELKHNLQDCNALHNAVGTINPRNPGLPNKLIQFAKKLMRRSLSWYTRPLHQFHGAVTRSLNELAQAVENCQNQLSRIDNFEQLELSWRQNLPAFLNAVSTVNAFGHELRGLRRELEQAHQKAEQGLHSLRQEIRQELQQEVEQGRQSVRQEMDGTVGPLRDGLQRTDASVAAIWERIEFVRCEMLFEMKYGKRAFGAPGTYEELDRAEPRIISLKKLAAARKSGLRLNLGCGHLPLSGYVNVDRRELPGVDIVADVTDLPFAEREVQEIFSAHLLEHFPQEMLRRRLLPIWHSLLMPGGTFRAVVPDGEAMLAGITAGNYSFSDFREVLFGAQDYDGDFHFNLFTPGSLCDLLEEAGFVDVRVNDRARRNGKCFEVEVSAGKPPSHGFNDVLSRDTKEASAEIPAAEEL